MVIPVRYTAGLATTDFNLARFGLKSKVIE